MPEKEKITHRWLLSYGFHVDEKESEMFQTHWKEEAEWCKEPLMCYYNEDHRICIHHRWTNRYGEGYNVHIDNPDYESVGYLEVLYVDDLYNFIKLSYDEK